MYIMNKQMNKARAPYGAPQCRLLGLQSRNICTGSGAITTPVVTEYEIDEW